MDINLIKDSVNKCSENNEEFIPFKEIFLDSLCNYITNFQKYNLEPDYENFCSQLSKLKIIYTKESNKLVDYDFKTNTMKINTQQVQKINDTEEMLNMFNLAILSMLTYVYNIETDSFNNGVTFEANGKTYGEYINEKIGERIQEIFFGNIAKYHYEAEKKVETIELPTASDQICMDMQALVGSDNLFTYYLNGRGDLFFNKLSVLFPTQEECIEFVNNVDNLKESDQSKDNEYYKKIEELVKVKKSLNSDLKI